MGRKKNNVDVEYNMAKLVLARGRNIHLGLDLNDEPMEGNDVDDQPTPIVELSQAREMPDYYEILLGSIF